MGKSNVLAVNWHNSLYRLKRMLFGITSAFAILQRRMDQALRGLDRTGTLQVDVVSSEMYSENHQKNLDALLKRIDYLNVTFRLEKRQLISNSLNYLGHRIDIDGLHSTDEKVKDIQETPIPTGVSDLRSFLGLVHYFGRFVNDIVQICEPHHNLLKKHSGWSRASSV